MKNQRALGKSYEKIAGNYLEMQGYEILQYNYQCRTGELDIVARDGNQLVFCEVKYRTSGKNGHPLEAITVGKQRKICQTAMVYMLEHGLTNFSCRFDVVAILGNEIHLVKNAFDYMG